MDPSILWKYFPGLTPEQKAKFERLGPLYAEWNEKINLISRKDIHELHTRHVLHSLAIAKFISFQPATKILDVGTGGGFPGLPLAILFEESSFTLIDSIRKKIGVVDAITKELELTNVLAIPERAENIRGSFDFIVSRAVAQTKKLMNWTKGKINPRSQNQISNGWILLKGGNLNEELNEVKVKCDQIELSEYYSEPFFQTKKIIYIPR